MASRGHNHLAVLEADLDEIVERHVQRERTGVVDALEAGKILLTIRDHLGDRREFARWRRDRYPQVSRPALINWMDIAQHEAVLRSVTGDTLPATINECRRIIREFKQGGASAEGKAAGPFEGLPTITRPGDLFVLGDVPTLASLLLEPERLHGHVIACADATAVRFALNGVAAATLALTDPPYGQDLDAGFDDAEDSWPPQRWADAHRNFPAAYVLQFHQPRRAADVEAGLRLAGYDPKDRAHWIRQGAHESRRGRRVVEAISVGARPGDDAMLVIDDSTDRFDPGERAETRPHATPKPSRLMRRLIEAGSRPGDVVIDPFIGTGATVLACEQTGRRCLGLDIDPRYVDICIRRWQRLTDRKALLWRGRGEYIPFDELPPAAEDPDRPQPLAEALAKGRFRPR